MKILDPAGNEYSASDTATSMPKPEDDEGQELTARIDTIIPVLSELSIASSNAGAESDPEKTGHLLAMEGDELILYFKTSERVLGFDETSSKPGLKPEVEFISALTGEDKRFVAVVTRNNTDSDGGLEWKAVLDVNSSTHSELAELESDLGFLITVETHPAMNENWDLMQQEYPVTPSQPTTVPAKMARVDLKPPEVETFAFTSSNAGLNNDDFGDTRLVRDGDTLTLSFQTSGDYPLLWMLMVPGNR